MSMNEAKKTPEGKRDKPVKRRSWKKTVLMVCFVYIPGFCVVITAILLLAAKLYLTPDRVEKLITENYAKSMNGSISLDVKEFSPYSGFVIENIAIKNSKEFGNTNFLTMKKFVFSYSFFRLFTGSVRFYEIGMYDPKIYLTQKKGVWNYECLAKPAKKEEVKQKNISLEKPEKKSDDKTASKEIRLPVSVEFLLKIVISNLEVHTKADTFNSSLKGFSFTTDVYLPPVKTIPKSIKALMLLEKLSVSLNPSEKLDMNFNSNDATVEPPLVLTWNLLFSKKGDIAQRFENRFKLGTYNTPVRFKKSHLAPLNFLVDYDLYFDPAQDYLKVNSFRILFRNDKWIDLGGDISKVSTNHNINLYMKESHIDLMELYPYYRAITHDDSLKFSGVIQLAPLSIKGNVSRIDTIGKIKMIGINTQMPGFVFSMPQFDLDYHFIKTSSIQGTVGLRIPSFAYIIDRSRSAPNAFMMDIKMNASGSAITIDEMKMRYYNPQNDNNCLFVALNGEINAASSTKGHINITKLTFNKNELTEVLPGQIAKSLEAIPLKKEITASIDTYFDLAENNSADVKAKFVLPDYYIDDLYLTASVVQQTKQQKIQVKRVELGSKKNGVALACGGFVELKKQPISDSDLRFELTVDYPKKRKAYENWELTGLIKLTARMTGDLEDGRAKGNAVIKRLYVENQERYVQVDNVNLAFPFEYDFRIKYEGNSMIALDKSTLIENDNFSEKDNFTIDKIYASHPTQNVKFEYIRDFSAAMVFKKNVFDLVRLKATLMDGSIYGRDTLFYLADLKKKNMEYRLKLDGTNIDIGKLENAKSTDKTAEISFNADFSGKGINFEKEFSPTGYFNLFKLEKKIAKKLMNALSQENGKSKMGKVETFVVDRLNKPVSMHFILEYGSAYATVFLERKILVKWLIPVKIQNDKIEYERQSVQELLRRIREDNKDYD